MKKKESYLAPNIALIPLDNDISLQLASDNNPMGDPIDWSYNQLATDPIKNQLV